jgi:hypothetical protein
MDARLAQAGASAGTLQQRIDAALGISASGGRDRDADIAA